MNDEISSESVDSSLTDNQKNRKIKIVSSVLLIIVLIVGIGIFLTSQANKKISQVTNSNSTKSVNSSDSSVASIFTSNLDVPWAIAFLPDNRMLVTERLGRVRIVNKDGSLEKDPAAEIKVDVKIGGEGGLLGIVLNPQFEKNNYVYLYYTYKSDGNDTLNKVVRMKFENDKLISEEVIVDKIPGAIYHNGGRIKFGPDGHLYITTGDARDSSKAQDKNSLAGKILRLTDEGKVISGSPFNNPTYSYGHRNPQGIAWDSAGNLWETEHGRSLPTGYDELNFIQIGKNYGWEIIQGDETRSGMETPKINSGSSTAWAPSGAVFVGSSLFFAGLRGEALYEAVIENNQVKELKTHFKNEYGRLREVVLGPDGMLYVTTSNRDGRGSARNLDDKILKINPKAL